MNKIINGDSKRIISRKQDLGIDLVFTSPSYFFSTPLRNTKKYEIGIGETKEKYVSDISEIMSGCLRNSNEDATFIIIFGTQDDSKVKQIALMYEDKMKSEGLFLNSYKEFGKFSSECIVVMSKKEIKIEIPDFDSIQRYTDTTTYGVTSDDVLSWAISNFSQEGNLVADPFAGVGTTLLKSKSMKRRWFGIELSKLSFEKARKDLNE